MKSTVRFINWPTFIAANQILSQSQFLNLNRFTCKTITDARTWDSRFSLRPGHFGWHHTNFQKLLFSIIAHICIWMVLYLFYDFYWIIVNGWPWMQKGLIVTIQTHVYIWGGEVSSHSFSWRNTQEIENDAEIVSQNWSTVQDTPKERKGEQVFSDIKCFYSVIINSSSRLWTVGIFFGHSVLWLPWIAIAHLGLSHYVWCLLTMSISASNSTTSGSRHPCTDALSPIHLNQVKMTSLHRLQQMHDGQA
jgi:hypothetical protein